MKKTTKKKTIKKDVFFKNEKGILHRTDGPAIELANGSKAWYINGNKFPDEESFRKEYVRINYDNQKR